MPSRDAGFTLVEALVALALVGLVSLLLFEGMRFTQGAWQGRAASQQAHSQALEASHRFRAVLTGAVAPRLAQGFAGAPDRVSLITTARLPGQRAGGAQVVEFYREAGAFRARVRPFDAPDDTGGETLILAEEVTDLRFRYLGGDGVWSETWETPGRLPRLVEMRMTQRPVRHWPAIVVAPGTDPVPQ